MNKRNSGYLGRFTGTFSVVSVVCAIQLPLSAMAECESNNPDTLVSSNKLLGKWSSINDHDFFEFKGEGNIELTHVFPNGDFSKRSGQYKVLDGQHFEIEEMGKVWKGSIDAYGIKVVDPDKKTHSYLPGLPLLRERSKIYDQLLLTTKSSKSFIEIERCINKLEPVEITVFEPVNDSRTFFVSVEKGAGAECLALASADKIFDKAKIVEIPQLDRVPRKGYGLPIAKSYDELIFHAKPGVDSARVKALVDELGGTLLPGEMASFPEGKMISSFLRMQSSDLFSFLAPHLAGQLAYSFTLKASVKNVAALQEALLDLNPLSLSLEKEGDLLSARITVSGPRTYRQSVRKAQDNRIFSNVRLLTDEDAKRGLLSSGTYVRVYERFSDPYNSLMFSAADGVTKQALMQSVKRLGGRKQSISEYDSCLVEFEGNQLIAGAIKAVMDSNLMHVHQNMALY